MVFEIKIVEQEVSWGADNVVGQIQIVTHFMQRLMIPQHNEEYSKISIVPISSFPQTECGKKNLKKTNVFKAHGYVSNKKKGSAYFISYSIFFSF